MFLLYCSDAEYYLKTLPTRRHYDITLTVITLLLHKLTLNPMTVWLVSSSFLVFILVGSIRSLANRTLSATATMR